MGKWLTYSMLVLCISGVAAGAVYPGKDWATKTPDEVGLDGGKLAVFSEDVGGFGCVVRHGYMVYTWGDASRRMDVASAAKPIYAYFLLKAVEEGRIPSVDQPVSTWEPRLKEINAGLDHKDARITWRHMANQISCYGLVEEPGTAYAYNDWQMALLFDTLFTKVYGVTHATVDESVLHTQLTDLIRCQDEPSFLAFGVDDRPGRVAISPRDFARFGLLYLRGGRWKGEQLLRADLARMAVTSPLPNSIPRAGDKAAEMMPGQRSIGSRQVPDNQTDHMGSYSWLWWINGADREGKQHWPDAPTDAYGCFGHGGKRAMVILPSLDLIVSWNDTRIDGRDMENDALKRLIDSVVGPTIPYPPSGSIKGVSFDWSTHTRAAPGSDNWPVTWADDGHQYTAWGDGGGFGGTNSQGRVSLGVARIEGPWDDHQGHNVWGGHEADHPATFEGKSYGIVCIDGVLTMWVGMFAPRNDPFKEVRLATSADHGATWTLADWSFTKRDGVMMPTICQFGRNYAGARDAYVYHYLIHYQGEEGPDDYPDKVPWLVVQRPGRIDLARVPHRDMRNRSTWEFFERLDDQGKPVWTRELSHRRPVFRDDNGVGWCISVSYNAGLERYLLCSEHTETHRGKLGIFDAPEPWGPWTTVAYFDNWGEGHVPLNTFYWNFSNKWLSPDGTGFSLIFTGRQENDSWNVLRGVFGRP